MKLRFAQGHGKEPIFVSLITKDRGGAGSIVLSAEGVAKYSVPFSSEPEFLSLLQKLVHESVPFSVGGHCPGPSDEVGFLIDAGRLAGIYLEISWSAPGHWSVREIGKASPPWEKIEDVSLLANVGFNPHSLSTGTSSV